MIPNPCRHILTDWRTARNAGPPDYQNVSGRQVRYCTWKGCNYHEARVVSLVARVAAFLGLTP